MHSRSYPWSYNLDRSNSSDPRHFGVQRSSHFGDSFLSLPLSGSMYGRNMTYESSEAIASRNNLQTSSFASFRHLTPLSTDLRHCSALERRHTSKFSMPGHEYREVPYIEMKPLSNYPSSSNKTLPFYPQSIDSKFANLPLSPSVHSNSTSTSVNKRLIKRTDYSEYFRPLLQSRPMLRAGYRPRNRTERENIDPPILRERKQIKFREFHETTPGMQKRKLSWVLPDDYLPNLVEHSKNTEAQSDSDNSIQRTQNSQFQSDTDGYNSTFSRDEILSFSAMHTETPVNILYSSSNHTNEGTQQKKLYFDVQSRNILELTTAGCVLDKCENNKLHKDRDTGEKDDSTDNGSGCAHSTPNKANNSNVENVTDCSKIYTGELESREVIVKRGKQREIHSNKENAPFNKGAPGKLDKIKSNEGKKGADKSLNDIRKYSPPFIEEGEIKIENLELKIQQSKHIFSNADSKNTEKQKPASYFEQGIQTKKASLPMSGKTEMAKHGETPIKKRAYGGEIENLSIATRTALNSNVPKNTSVHTELNLRAIKNKEPEVRNETKDKPATNDADSQCKVGNLDQFELTTKSNSESNSGKSKKSIGVSNTKPGTRKAATGKPNDSAPETKEYTLCKLPAPKWKKEHYNKPEPSMSKNEHLFAKNRSKMSVKSAFEIKMSSGAIIINPIDDSKSKLIVSDKEKIKKSHASYQTAEQCKQSSQATRGELKIFQAFEKTEPDSKKCYTKPSISTPKLRNVPETLSQDQMEGKQTNIGKNHFKQISSLNSTLQSNECHNHERILTTETEETKRSVIENAVCADISSNSHKKNDSPKKSLAKTDQSSVVEKHTIILKRQTSPESFLTKRETENVSSKNDENKKNVLMTLASEATIEKICSSDYLQEQEREFSEKNDEAGTFGGRQSKCCAASINLTIDEGLENISVFTNESDKCTDESFRKTKIQACEESPKSSCAAISSKFDCDPKTELSSSTPHSKSLHEISNAKSRDLKNGCSTTTTIMSVEEHIKPKKNERSHKRKSEDILEKIGEMKFHENLTQNITEKNVMKFDTNSDEIVRDVSSNMDLTQKLSEQHVIQNKFPQQPMRNDQNSWTVKCEAKNRQKSVTIGNDSSTSRMQDVMNLHSANSSVVPCVQGNITTPLKTPASLQAPETENIPFDDKKQKQADLFSCGNKTNPSPIQIEKPSLGSTLQWEEIYRNDSPFPSAQLSSLDLTSEKKCLPVRHDFDSAQFNSTSVILDNEIPVCESENDEPHSNSFTTVTPNESESCTLEKRNIYSPTSNRMRLLDKSLKFKKYSVVDFQFLTLLGKGSFGKVLLVQLKNSNLYFAMKCLRKDAVLEDEDVESTMIERRVLALGTRHPFICKLYCTFQTESHLCFVMEYLKGGDLMFHIQENGRFGETRTRFYAAQIVSALKFLHKKGIVYRDIKLDNVMLDEEGNIRLVDFGMCQCRIYREECMPSNFCGTPVYIAPEIIEGKKYNESVDWWSFGILLYEMLTGKSPFIGTDEDELFWCICNEEPTFPLFLSKEAQNIIQQLLIKCPEKRLGMKSCSYGDISTNAFFHSIDWDKLETMQLKPPFKPSVNHASDTSNFDTTFTTEYADLTPVDNDMLTAMDQRQFEGFSYTNPHITG